MIHGALPLGGTPLWRHDHNRQAQPVLWPTHWRITGTIVKNLRLIGGPTQATLQAAAPDASQVLESSAATDARGWGSGFVALFNELYRRTASLRRLTLRSRPRTAPWADVPPNLITRPRPRDSRFLRVGRRLKETAGGEWLTWKWGSEAHRRWVHLRTRAPWLDAERSSGRHRPDATISAATGFRLVECCAGRVEDSLQTLETGLRVDPLSLDLRRILSHIQLVAGRYDAALRNCQAVVDVDPDFPFAELFCIRILIAQGRLADALARINKHPEMNFLPTRHHRPLAAPILPRNHLRPSKS